MILISMQATGDLLPGLDSEKVLYFIKQTNAACKIK
jgi:hypothetical protein